MQQEQNQCPSSKACSLPCQYRVSGKWPEYLFPAVNQEMVLITDREQAMNEDHPLVILPPCTGGVCVMPTSPSSSSS